MEALDVIIIGAGAAGLTAAYDRHHDTSHTYKILEASAGLGGRLQKRTNFADFPIDIGGEWLHVPPSVLDDIYNDPDNEEQPSKDIETVEYIETVDEWDGLAWETLPYGQDDFKYVNYTWFDFFDSWIAPDLNITYDCPVILVDWSNSPVVLECLDGRKFTAKHVIVTASIGVLQARDIEFIPALSEEVQDAIDTYYFMGGLKVFMRFKETFYKEAFEIVSDFQGVEIGDRLFWDETYGQETDDHVMGVFQVGDAAKPYVDMTDQQIFDVILEQLDEIYDGQATLSFIEGFVQNWNNQKFVKGAYTALYDEDEDVNAIEVMRQSLDGRVFFAGEAIPYSSWEYGFAHEAAFSGRAAASKVAALLDPDDSRSVFITQAPSSTAISVFSITNQLLTGITVMAMFTCY